MIGESGLASGLMAGIIKAPLGFIHFGILSESMPWLEGMIAFAVVLGILVIFHEFGHFIVAKLSGIRVDEFAFGFGPKWITLFKKGETEYTIHPFPLGGFVKLAGMEMGEPVDSHGFNAKPVLTRMAVIFAGPFMNMVLAVLLFIIMGVTVGAPIAGVVVEKISPNTEASRVGLQPHDTITAIDGKMVLFPTEAINTIRKNVNIPIQITVHRGDKVLQFSVTPKLATPQMLGAADNARNRALLAKKPIGIVGFQASPNVLFQKTSILPSVTNGFVYTYGATLSMIRTLFGQVGGAAVGAVPVEEVRKQVGGPIAIFFVIKVAIGEGMAMVLLLLALLSVNLGIVNLIPIPLLDGGHLAFLFMEGLRGKPISPEKQAAVQWMGFSILILLMMFMIFNDISNLPNYLGK